MRRKFDRFAYFGRTFNINVYRNLPLLSSIATEKAPSYSVGLFSRSELLFNAITSVEEEFDSSKL